MALFGGKNRVGTPLLDNGNKKGEQGGKLVDVRGPDERTAERECGMGTYGGSLI